MTAPRGRPKGAGRVRGYLGRPPTQRQAVVELLGAAVLWGLSFTAIKWCLLSMGPLWTNGTRLFISMLVSAPLWILAKHVRAGATADQARLALAPGLLLAAGMALVAWGMQYTTVTKAGFITALYVGFVPLIESIVLRRPVFLTHALLAGLAILGMALICRPETGDWSWGDLIVLLGAIVVALHILAIDAAAPLIRSVFAFNFFQTGWACLLTLSLAIPLERRPSWPLPPITWVGLLTLAIGVTLLGFIVQVRSQRVLAPSLVSIFFVLETPFAALFAYLAFGETLGATQWVGGALILFAAGLATRIHLR